MTITQVTKEYGVSTRTLRYYEQLGLFRSGRIEGYSYRAYDEETCVRLRQIIILRKLRIPLKQIAALLTDADAVSAIEVFEQNIGELDGEIDSLTTIRNILKRLVDELREKANVRLKSDLLADTELLSMLELLPTLKNNFKEDRTMEDLNKASVRLGKLTDRDVRIVYLPPATVAAYKYVGDEPENKVSAVIDKFVRDNDLIHVKPDLRHYGFNSPNPADETNFHGYEMWVTIPDGMNVPEPLVKKQFAGGLYAAHMIPFGAFEEWGWLNEWVQNSTKYEYIGNWDNDIMFGWLEEHLNYVNHVNLNNTEPEGMQLDLLIPVKEITADK